MAIPQYITDRFKTMLLAHRNGDLAVLECQDPKTGEAVYAIVAVQQPGAGRFEMVPLGVILQGNPYDQLVPPSVEAMEIEQ